MARRRRRPSMKAKIGGAKVRRDRNGKFVNKAGQNKSRGSNAHNLQQGRKSSGPKKRAASTIAKPAKKSSSRKSSIVKSKPQKMGKKKKIVIGGAVAAVGIYGYHKATGKSMRKTAGTTIKVGASAVRTYGKAFGDIRGSGEHIRAVRGVVTGKGRKSGMTFLQSSYNWNQMKRKNPGQRMYTVGH